MLGKLGETDLNGNECNRAKSPQITPIDDKHSQNIPKVGDHELDVDPHLAWEVERQAFSERIDALMAVPDEMRPPGQETKLKALDEAEWALIDKIRTTPARTIEGALLMIEVPTRCEIKLGYHGLHDYETRALKSNLLAIETIRRLLVEREV